MALDLTDCVMEYRCNVPQNLGTWAIETSDYVRYKTFVFVCQPETGQIAGETQQLSIFPIKWVLMTSRKSTFSSESTRHYLQFALFYADKSHKNRLRRFAKKIPRNVEYY